MLLTHGGLFNFFNSRVAVAVTVAVANSRSGSGNGSGSDSASSRTRGGGKLGPAVTVVLATSGSVINTVKTIHCNLKKNIFKLFRLIT